MLPQSVEEDNNMNNWLGFSLDPSHLPSTSPQQLQLQQNTNECYSHYPSAAQVTELPLRSDGSLCIMEALRRDWRDLQRVEHQQMKVDHYDGDGPKLEDFLGGPTHYYPEQQQQQQYKTNNQFPFVHCAQRGGDYHPCYPTYAGIDGNYNAALGVKVKEENTEMCNMQQMAAFQAQSSSPNHHGVYADCKLELPPCSSGGSLLSPSSSSSAWFPLRNKPAPAKSKSNTVAATVMQSLTLSMSPTSAHADTNSNVTSATVLDAKKRKAVNATATATATANRESVPRRSIDTFGQRTSQYRGVTRHRWTGRYEAHLWDNSCRKEGQTRKGRQVYLGGYDKEEKAAKAYDLAALKYWGPSTHINFPLGTYEKELEEMKNMTRQEYVANLRRKSSGFSRGASIYRGVTRHHQHGRWQARIGRVAGNKDLYLGTFSTQEEAAEAYDIAAIKFRGTSAVTNFDISRYDVVKICTSNTLISVEVAKRPKQIEAPDTHSCFVSNSPPLLPEGPQKTLDDGTAKNSPDSLKDSNNLDCPPKIVNSWVRQSDAEENGREAQAQAPYIECFQHHHHSQSPTLVIQDLMGMDSSGNNSASASATTEEGHPGVYLTTTDMVTTGSNISSVNNSPREDNITSCESSDDIHVYGNMNMNMDMSMSMADYPQHSFFFTSSRLGGGYNNHGSTEAWVIPIAAAAPPPPPPPLPSVSAGVSESSAQQMNTATRPSVSVAAGPLPMFALWNQ